MNKIIIQIIFICVLPYLAQASKSTEALRCYECWHRVPTPDMMEDYVGTQFSPDCWLDPKNLIKPVGESPKNFRWVCGLTVFRNETVQFMHRTKTLIPVSVPLEDYSYEDEGKVAIYCDIDLCNGRPVA